jgi:hypothetical protein
MELLPPTNNISPPSTSLTNNNILPQSSENNPTQLPSATIYENLEAKCYSVIPFEKYIHMGYNFYLKWLSMTLGSNYTPHINFCIARNLNVFQPYIMGVDLEVRYILKRLESLFGAENMNSYKPTIVQTLKNNLNLSPAYIYTELDSYFKDRNLFHLTLTNEEFQQRLHKIPISVLEKHSRQCWRNSNVEMVNKNLYPISLEDILNGESLLPPSSKHIGLQILAMCGCIPTSVFNPKKYDSHAVTFIS